MAQMPVILSCMGKVKLKQYEEIRAGWIVWACCEKEGGEFQAQTCDRVRWTELQMLMRWKDAESFSTTVIYEALLQYMFNRCQDEPNKYCVLTFPALQL